MGKYLGDYTSDDFQTEVPYGPKEDEAFVTLRYMSQERTKAILKKCTKGGFDSRTHQASSATDNDKFVAEWGAWAVVGWRGFVDKDGNELPFTPEERDKLMRYHKKFSAFVFAVADDIDELTRAEREKIRGN